MLRFFFIRNVGTVLFGALLAAVGFFILYPLASLFIGSFATRGILGFRAYVDTYSDLDNYRLLWTTLWLAVVRTTIATGLAILFAWIVTRTNTPLKRILEILIWISFFMPSLPFVLAWTILALPKTGLLNIWLTQALHLNSPVFNIQSYAGIIFVSVLPATSVLFLLITPAFRGMDASLEEASRMAGAKTVTTMRRVTLPLLQPAILGAAMLALARMMDSFEAELLLGMPAKIFVFTTRVYDRVKSIPPDYEQAMALSTVFLLIVLVMMLFQTRLLSRTERYSVISGRGFSSRGADIGWWKYVTFSCVLVYFVVAVVMPLGTLILGTFMKVPGLFDVPEPFTTEHYLAVLKDRFALAALKNTFIVSVAAATLGMALYSLVSYVVVRTRFSGRSVLGFMSWLPYAVPSMILALGFLWALVGGIRLPFATYGSLQLIVLVFLIRGMPVGVRVMDGSMVQLGKELEESSRVLGASWVYTFRRIVAPLIRPAFMAAWVILFVIAVRDVATVALLYGPHSRVISVIMLEYWTSYETSKSIVLGLVMVVITGIGVVFAGLFGLRRVPVA